MSLVSSVLSAVGKEVLGGVSQSNRISPQERASQLDRFDKRFEVALDPEKAEFKDFLETNRVTNSLSAESLRDSLKQNLYTNPKLASFVSANGGLNSSLQIEKTAIGYDLVGQNGDVYSMNENSLIGETVDRLYKLESVLQTAALQPSLSLDQVVDQCFSNQQPQAAGSIIVR